MGVTAVVAIVVAAVVVVTLVAWSVTGHHRLVRHRNACHHAFARIDGHLRRRHELVPRLVETVGDCLPHEQQTLDAVVAAREAAVAARDRARVAPGEPGVMRHLSDAETAVTRTLGRLLAVAEPCPEPEASRALAPLAEELASVESRLACARQAYDDAVRAYNHTRETFPTSLLAARFGFGPAAPLCLDGSGQWQTARISR